MCVGYGRDGADVVQVSHWRARLRQIQRLKQWAVTDSADARAQMDEETRSWDVRCEPRYLAMLTLCSHWTR